MLKIRGESGSAVSMALFLIITISIFGLSASGVVTSDFIATKKYSNGIKAGFIARAGVEKAIQVLINKKTGFGHVDEKWQNDKSSFKDVPLGGGYFNVNYDLNGQKIYGIVDAESKVNINTALEDMLAALTGIERNDAFKIIIAREKAIFRRPEELVTSGIISHELFYGPNGLKDQITVWGNGKININTASRQVLSTVSGLLPENIDNILAFRLGLDGIQGTSDDRIFESVSDLKDIQTGNQTWYPKNLLTVRSKTFYIRAEGTIHAKSPTRAKRVIEAVVDKHRNGIRISYWNMI